jgi:Tfp pilus assembly protein PilN
LGCVEGQSGAAGIPIALTGWTTDKQKITEYISMLQEYPFINQIKLVSMEQDRQYETIARFKIVCTLKLIRN